MILIGHTVGAGSPIQVICLYVFHLQVWKLRRPKGGPSKHAESVQPRGHLEEYSWPHGSTGGRCGRVCQRGELSESHTGSYDTRVFWDGRFLQQATGWEPYGARGLGALTGRERIL
jgi:hypothetical protein